MKGIDVKVEINQFLQTLSESTQATIRGGEGETTTCTGKKLEVKLREKNPYL